MRESNWSEKELQYLIKHWHRVSNKEIAEKLGRTESAVRMKATNYITFEMMKKCKWSEYEEKLLLNLYGTIHIEELSKRMKRTEFSIHNKMEDLEGTIDPFQLRPLYYTFQISEFLGVSVDKVRVMYNRGEIPIFKVNHWRLAIKQDEFWDWLKANLHVPNYKKIKDEAELDSPEWYREIIKQEKRKSREFKHGEPWTSREDALLWSEMLKGTKNKEIAKMLNRSYRSITGRVIVLSKRKMKKAS